MIAHIAVFTWKPEVTPEDIAGVTAALAEMATKIPALKGYAAQPNLHLRPGGSDFGVTALVEDEAGLAAYLDSPEHVAVYDAWLGRMIGERYAAQIPVADGATI